jgi:uncharacterized cysteine cluster protein YcgN (CxxCxxCC family)
LSDTQPFWRTKTLDEMTPSEWERLCDGCGRCCLVKLEDEDTGDIYLTRLACGLLDIKSCRCSDYENRQKKMPDCISITPEQVRTLSWLPPTCAYRMVEEGRDLQWWHPLVSGTFETVHEAGISVRGKVRSETGIKTAWLHHYIIDDFVDDGDVPQKKGRKKAAKTSSGT